MHFQFEMPPIVAPQVISSEIPAAVPVPESLDILRQILEIQREQLYHQRVATAAHDSQSRWRAFLSRWDETFPGLADGCRVSMPILERSYGKLIAELTDHLVQSGDDALDNEFALQEFLDRFGMRIAQLGTILNLVGPLADAGAREPS